METTPTAAGPRSWQDCLACFHAACAAGNRPGIAELRGWVYRVPAEDQPDALVDLVAEHLRYSWRAGKGTLLEQYMAALGADFDTLASADVLPCDLVEREFIVRHEFPGHSDYPELAEYARRFPGRDDVLDALEARRLDAGRYVKVKPLGRGGLGRVWLAYDRHLGRHVALKEPLPEFAHSSEVLGRLAREARVTGGLEHPAIVSVHEMRPAGDGPPFYVMRLVHGRTLEQALSDRDGKGRLPWNELLPAFATVCDALAYAHSRGVIHRDLKPSNVMVGSFGEVQVMDWGLAKVLPREGSTSGDTAPPHEPPTVLHVAGSDASQPGAVLGTPGYMAPEQARGDHVDERADVFGLGAMLGVLLTGQPPYVGSANEVYRQAAEGDVSGAFAQLEDCGADGELIQLCKECLAADRESRPRDAGVVAQRMAAYQAGVQERLRRAELERVAAQARATVERKRRRLAVGLAAAVLALVTLAATALVSWQRLQYERARAAVAERKAQRTSVESYMEEARVDCQRGKWQDAVAIYDKALALEASQPDNVSLRLDKIKALVASLDVQSAIRELESLARGRDFQGREGSVLLWQADLALGPRFDVDQRLLLVRQALAKGLPPVEEAYAKSLLAESSPEAVSHLEFALRLDSTHYHANGMLTLMLLSLGRLKEARERAVFGEMLFPQDPAFKILQAVVCVLQDDAAAANRLLDEIQSVHGTEQTEPFRIAIRRLNKFRDSWDPWAPMNFDFKSALVDFLKLQTQLSRFSTQVPEQASPEEAIRSIGASFCVPPCLRRGLGRLMHSLTSYALKPDSNKAIEELGEAIRLHPEGTLHYVRGMLFFCEERHEEAEKELVLATKTPAIFAVRLPALSFAAASEAKLAWDQPQHNEEMATRGLRNLRQRLALGPLHQEESYLFARMTRKAGEYDLARLVLSDWQWQAQEEVRKAKQDGRQPGAFAWAQLNPFNWQRQPQEDPRIQKEFMLLELEAGNYARAIEVAGKVLARDPKDPDAPGCRKEATDKLREQARQILAEKPAHAQGTDK